MQPTREVTPATVLDRHKLTVLGFVLYVAAAVAFGYFLSAHDLWSTLS